MKNYSEQTRNDVVTPGAYTPDTIVSDKTNIKIREGRVYDTSPSTNAFNTNPKVGDIIRMTGWPKYGDENNRIFVVTEVAPDDKYFKVDKEIKDVKKDLVESGVTIYSNPNTVTLSEATKFDVVVDALNLNTTASSPVDVNRDLFAITSDATVASFAEVDSDDVVQLTWAKLSDG